MQTTKNTILITRGGAGIGFALAETFIKAGNEVLICSRRESKLLKAKQSNLFNFAEISNSIHFKSK